MPNKKTVPTKTSKTVKTDGGETHQQAATDTGDKSLSAEPDAVSFLMDADRHLKAIALAALRISRRKRMSMALLA